MLKFSWLVALFVWCNTLLCCPISQLAAQQETRAATAPAPAPGADGTASSPAQQTELEEDSRYRELRDFRSRLHEAIDDEDFQRVPGLLDKIDKLSINYQRAADTLGDLTTTLAVIPDEYPLIRASVAQILGDVYFRLGDLSASMRYHEISVERFAKSGHRLDAIQSLRKIADAYRRMGKLENALSCSRGCLAMSEELDGSIRSANVACDYCRLGQVLDELGTHEKAGTAFRESIRCARTCNDVEATAAAYYAALDHHLRHQQFETAGELVVDVEALVTKGIPTVPAARLKNLIVRYLARTSDLGRAAELFATIDAVAVPELTEELLQTQEVLAMAENDLAAAYEASTQRHDAVELRHQEELRKIKLNLDKVTEFKELAEDEERKANLARLAAQQKVMISRRIRDVAIVVSICSFLFGLIFFPTELRRRTERRLREKEVESNQRLSQLVEEKTADLVAKMEEQNALQQQLEQKRRNEALGQLTGGVAHDINNVLQVVMTATEILAMDDTRLSDAQRSMIAASRESIATATDIVQQLLAFARRQRLRPQVLTVGELLLGKRQLLKTAVDDRAQLLLKVECPDAHVRVDVSQFISAIINLISNSRHALPNGGTIWVSATRIQETADGNEAGSTNKIRISVRDDGIGMTEDQQSRCCEPFFTTREIDGTGLGLSSVLGFVKQSGGELRIESAPNQGTTVTLQFPEHTDLAPAVVDNIGDFQLTGQFRVLLVEDNELVRMALETKLQSIDLDVDTCATADDAIRLLKKDSDFELVLSDIKMPGTLDGADLHRWVTESLPGTHVLLMTGYSLTEDLGARTYVLPKPFTDEQLLQKIREIGSGCVPSGEEWYDQAEWPDVKDRLMPR